MRAERERELETEREETGLEPLWPGAYAFMRCQKQSCESGPHCWVDSEGKHYKMYTGHLRRLEEYVAEHGIPETHNDVPLDLQHRLIVEDKERRDRRGKQAPNSGPSLPPINITNVLPGQSQQTSEPGGERGRPTSGYPSNQVGHRRLKFSGLRDDVLRAYATS
jgi:hypothetical protein